jgi:hypothetical protein
MVYDVSTEDPNHLTKVAREMVLYTTSFSLQGLMTFFHAVSRRFCVEMHEELPLAICLCKSCGPEYSHGDLQALVLDRNWFGPSRFLKDWIMS